MSHDHILKRLSEEAKDKQPIVGGNYQGLWGIDLHGKMDYERRLCADWHWLNDCPDCRYDLEESAMMNFDYDTYDPQHPDKNAWLVDYFYNEIRVTVPEGYLTPYNKNQLKKMRLFKVKGLKAGFAINSSHDLYGSPTEDLVAVHNNSPTKKLGAKMTMDAIRADAKTLDHFDGKLGKLYEPMGFKEYHAAEWDDQYAPEKWTYPKIDVEDTRHSSLVQTYTPEEADRIKQKYAAGNPDIVYRRLVK